MESCAMGSALGTQGLGPNLCLSPPQAMGSGP